MTRRRWIAHDSPANRAALPGAHARHLSQVLRAQIGQEFDISTGAEVRRGKVSSVHPDRVEFDLGDVVDRSSPTPLTVALSVFKFDRMEWAIEKCTELGASSIIPVIAARTESHLAAAAEKRVERWQRITKQASEQSRRVAPPEISPPIKLKQLLTMPADLRLVLSETERNLMLMEVDPRDATSALLAIGPEGGWEEQEVAAFQAAGWISASLGTTILRAETASIAAVAITAMMLNSNNH